jgi:mannose-6-phosphate isomerase-like protein (cupin superfamily)
MEPKRYYKGEYKEDSKEHGGWIVGRFLDDVRKTETMEVKYWEFKKGEEGKHLMKFQLHATECNFIIEGKVRGVIDGNPITLEAGDYVLVKPGAVSNFIEEVIIEPVRGITIKAPSLEGDTIKSSTE